VRLTIPSPLPGSAVAVAAPRLGVALAVPVQRNLVHVNVIVPNTSNGYIYTSDNLKDLLGALTGPRFNYI
jgi:hypothetical protein